MISEFPLFVFTTLAGIAAGAYVIAAFFPMGKDSCSKKPWLFPLVCGILLAAGLVVLPLHLGHPERMLIALSHPSAMIAQEAYWSMAFGIVVLIDFILTKMKGAAPRALRIVGAVAAVGLMLVMSNAYFVAMAVPAWASIATFPLFVVGDLAMGAALCALFDASLKEKPAFASASIALYALTACAFVAEAVRFASVGAGFVPFAIACAGPVAAVVALALDKKGKIAKGTLAYVVAACVFIGVIVARYAFYAACTL